MFKVFQNEFTGKNKAGPACYKLEEKCLGCAKMFCLFEEPLSVLNMEVKLSKGTKKFIDINSLAKVWK